ncbi:MAG: glycoside hydrolase family 35, partial [Phycisphaerae bacterium]|nr:glycoside hydrolase family 35 [Phycisphaerae bacterium]
MPRVSIDPQGLLVGGRRCWIVGAALEYSLLDPRLWSRSLSLLRQTGFNTVRTSVPWSLHERRRAKPDFEGSLDLRAFVELAIEQGLWVIVRLGPVVGGTFSGGGLPAWLSEIDGLRLREPQDEFLRLVSRWFDTVLSQLKGLA